MLLGYLLRLLTAGAKFIIKNSLFVQKLKDAGQTHTLKIGFAFS